MPAFENLKKNKILKKTKKKQFLKSEVSPLPSQFCNIENLVSFEFCASSHFVIELK